MQSKSIRLINAGKIDWWKTQVYYHSIAEQMKPDTPDTIILCSPASPYLCLGYHQNLNDIFDREKCSKLNLPVIRRSIGGGATYLDSNQFFYQFIFNQKNVPKSFNEIFSYLLALPVIVLNELGINVQLNHTNEIEVDGKRIAGTGGGLIGDASVVVGNFLFDFDYNTVADVWNVPDEDYRSLAKQALEENIITINTIDKNITKEVIENNLIKAIENYFKREVFVDNLSEPEIAWADELLIKMTDEEYLLQRDIKLKNDLYNLPLKISANAFVHYKNLKLFNKNAVTSLYVKNGIVQKCFAKNHQSERLFNLEKFLQNKALSELENHGIFN